MKTNETIKLYWLVSHEILEAIEATGSKRFPDRFLCNPVLNEGYAVQISQELDVAVCPVAYICEFEIMAADLSQFTIIQSENIYHGALEINNQNLSSLNDAILGQIRVRRVFKKWAENI